jgi:hypothetical protein
MSCLSIQGAFLIHPVRGPGGGVKNWLDLQYIQRGRGGCQKDAKGQSFLRSQVTLQGRQLKSCNRGVSCAHIVRGHSLLGRACCGQDGWMIPLEKGPSMRWIGMDDDTTNNNT